MERQVCHCFGVLAEAVLLTLLGSRLTLAGHCLAQSCQAVAHWLFSRQHLWSTRPVRETTYGEFFALKFEALAVTPPVDHIGERKRWKMKTQGDAAEPASPWAIL